MDERLKDEVTIPLMEERLEIGTGTVETGLETLRKRVEAYHETLDIPLAARTFDIERVVLNRPVEKAPEVRVEGDTTIYPLVEEQLVITRQLILKEEVRVTKWDTERRDTRTVTLTREHLDVTRTPVSDTETGDVGKRVSCNNDRMYEDFQIADHWTGETLHCVWKGTIVAIATRHADATDVRFSVNHKPVWIAMPNLAWVEQKRRTGFVITDYLAAQTAGRYLKSIIESGYDNGREMYTMTVDEVLEHAAAVVKEVGRTDHLPTLPVINDNVQPETLMGRLPADNVAQGVSVTMPDHPSSVIPTAN